MSIRRSRKRMALLIGAALTLTALGTIGAAAGLGSTYVDRHGVVHRVGPIIPHTPPVAYNPNSDGFYETVPSPQGYHCYDAGKVHGCYFTYEPSYAAPDLVYDQEFVDACVPAYLDDLYGPSVDYAFAERCLDGYAETYSGRYAPGYPPQYGPGGYYR